MEDRSPSLADVEDDARNACYYGGFNLFVTSASVKTTRYVKVRSCTAEAVRLEACGHPNEMPLRGSAPALDSAYTA